MFDRSRDWIDIDAIAKNGRADLDHARRWLAELLGVDAPQLGHLDSVIAAHRTGLETDLAEPPSPQRPGPDLGLEL